MLLVLEPNQVIKLIMMTKNDTISSVWLTWNGGDAGFVAPLGRLLRGRVVVVVAGGGGGGGGAVVRGRDERRRRFDHLVRQVEHQSIAWNKFDFETFLDILFCSFTLSRKNKQTNIL